MGSIPGEGVRWPLLRKRQRELVMTRMDEAILSEALRDTYPVVEFLDGEARRESLADCRLTTVKIRVREPDSVSGWLEFGRSRWLWDLRRLGVEPRQLSFDAPMLMSGDIFAGWDERNPADAFVPELQRKTWRIIARIATNQLKGGTVLSNILEWGSDVVTTADARRQNPWSVWAGHHALEWCAAGGPRRMLDGVFRPCDDWAPPQGAWYQGLRRRVEERYGPDFGLPPAEPPEGKASAL
jgi:hypothetical protein